MRILKLYGPIVLGSFIMLLGAYVWLFLPERKDTYAVLAIALGAVIAGGPVVIQRLRSMVPIVRELEGKEGPAEPAAKPKENA